MGYSGIRAGRYWIWLRDAPVAGPPALQKKSQHLKDIQ